MFPVYWPYGEPQESYHAFILYLVKQFLQVDYNK